MEMQVPYQVPPTTIQDADVVNILIPHFFKNEIQDIPEYTGPMEIKNVPGCTHGRGVFATKPIRRGELILAHKAFAMYTVPGDTEWDPTPEDSSSVHPFHRGLVFRIYKKLRTCPELIEQFYKLYDGTNSSQNVESYELKDVTYARIEKIVQYNNFKFPATLKLMNHEVIKMSINEIDQGIAVWTSYTSYINHACIPNCCWIIIGDTMFIRAVRSIDEGEQIFISYLKPGSLSERLEVFESRHFKCNCEFCKFESQYSLSIDDISKIFLELKPKVFLQKLGEDDLKFIEGKLFELENFVKSNPFFNYHIVKEIAEVVDNQQELVSDFFTALFNKKHYDIYFKGIHLFYKALEVVRFRAVETSMFSALLLRSYITAKNKSQARLWVLKFKRDLITAYGNANIIKLFPKTYKKVLESGWEFQFLER